MKTIKILACMSGGFVLAACQPVQPPAEATPPAEAVAETTPDVAPTITGGEGAQCLKFEVMADDFAFIRAGTRGTYVTEGDRKFIDTGSNRYEITNYVKDYGNPLGAC